MATDTSTPPADSPAGDPREAERARQHAYLVACLRDDRNEAASVLADLYQQPLVRFCWGYLGRVEDAEDAVQDVFVKVLKADNVPDNFRAWIYKIARNHCLNLLRSRRRRRDDRPLLSGAAPAADWTGHLTRLVHAEQHSCLGKLVAELSEEHQEVLRLRYADTLSRAAIAEILDLPESVVKSRLYEGIKKLRSQQSQL